MKTLCKKENVKKVAKKRGRPKKGEERIKDPTRLEKQAAGMGLSDMLDDLPSACDVGTKKNSKGYKTSWIGYKLHIDAEVNTQLIGMPPSAESICNL